MSSYIHSIQTAVPDNFYTQEFARDFMKTNIGKGGAVSRMLHRIYAMSGIEKRHCVINEFREDAGSGPFFDPENGEVKNPGTGIRNEIYTAESKKIFKELANKSVNDSGFKKNEITHVITVSCTGFYAPGPDYLIVRELGLPPSTRRYHLGFMGCYAAFPALRMAQSICTEDSDAVVLIACVELCTIHLQFTQQTDALISASVFADGGASAVVSARQPSGDKNALHMVDLSTTLTPTGEADMAWSIGDNGFDMILSTYVPDIIESNLKSLLAPYLNSKYSADDFGYWAVHPGGRAILDKVQNNLNLRDELLAPSRETLRDYGNMSSATILFVLKNILDRTNATATPLISMAFGPGLTVETGIFNLIPAKTSQDPNRAKDVAFSA